MYREFISYMFEYTPSTIEGKSDVVKFIDEDTKQVHRFTFAIGEGWWKTVNRQALPVQRDYLIGYMTDLQKGIQIKIKNEVITYTKLHIKPVNDIY